MNNNRGEKIVWVNSKDIIKKLRFENYKLYDDKNYEDDKVNYIWEYKNGKN